VTRGGLAGLASLAGLAVLASLVQDLTIYIQEMSFRKLA